MSLRQQIDSMFNDMLKEHGDARLASHGFSRRVRQRVYRRGQLDTEQLIICSTGRNPGGARSTGWHLYMQAEVRMPRVQATLSELISMCEHAESGEAGKGLRIELMLLAPYGECEPWNGPIREVSDVRSRASALIGFVETQCVPFLDRLWTPSDLCELAASGDPQARSLHQLPLAAVSAMLLCERPRDAYSVLKKRFGQLGPRRRMRRLFEYVAAQAGEEPPTF